MKRLIAIVILLSTLLFGAAHSGVFGGLNHDMGGMMDVGANCLSGPCPGNNGAVPGDCLVRCIAAAQQNTVPPTTAPFALAIIVLIVLSAVRPAVAFVVALKDKYIATIYLHQRLSTVVLRN